MNILCSFAERGWKITNHKIKKPIFLYIDRIPIPPEKPGTIQQVKREELMRRTATELPVCTWLSSWSG